MDWVYSDAGRLQRSCAQQWCGTFRRKNNQDDYFPLFQPHAGVTHGVFNDPVIGQFERAGFAFDDSETVKDVFRDRRVGCPVSTKASTSIKPRSSRSPI